MRQTFDTTDIDVASGIFGDLYTSMRMRGGDERPYMRIVSTQIGRARVDRTTLKLVLEGVASPQDTMYVVGVRTGGVDYSAVGPETAAGADRFCYSVPARLSLNITMDNVDSDVVAFDQTLLNEAAAVDPADDAPVRLLSTRPHSAAATARLWRTAKPGCTD